MLLRPGIASRCLRLLSRVIFAGEHPDDDGFMVELEAPRHFGPALVDPRETANVVASNSICDITRPENVCGSQHPLAS